MLIADTPGVLGPRNLRVGPMFALIGDPTVTNGEAMIDLDLVRSVDINLNPSKAHGSIPGGHQLASATIDRSINPEVSLTLDDMQARVFAALFDNATQQTQTAAVTGVDTTNDTFTVSGDLTQEAGSTSGDLITVTGSTGNDGTYELASDATYDSTNDETTFEVVESVEESTADGDLNTFLEGMMFETQVRRADPPTLVLIPSTVDGKAGSIDEPAWWFPAVSVTDDGGITQDDSEGEDANSQYEPTLTGLYREEDQAATALPSQIRQGFYATPADVPGVDLSWSLPSAYQ